ncbi:putative dehydrogenase and related protein [Vibrio nigripulchritudo SOn1]|uniref:Dehydrogenase and related protein n=1 Tax=Vibrio nigripulchritudo SOn1 TaxID=1238450 RepID=A0AAV2VTV5_9VIBR|nr:Gfo/Idh/MocA family oxidoreductase [Vibrio nigripulchritudo]CCO48057.1 putative dehydrogenase and related protein [Vibrio nigripulchritudo SOn1]
MLTSPVRLGLIGLGEAAQSLHLPTLFHHPDKFQVTAVFDISQTLVTEVCQRYHVANGYNSAEELIESDGVDAVVIMSPDPMHFAHTKLAVQAGKPVLLEKPSCLLPRHVSELIELGAQHQVDVTVGYMRVYAKAYALAQTKLSELGEIKSVRVKDLQREGDYFLPQVSDLYYPSDHDVSQIERSKLEEDLQRHELLGAKAHSDLLWKCYRVLTGAAIHNLAALRQLIQPPKRVVSAFCNPTGEHIGLTLDYGSFFATYEILIDNIPRVDANIEITSDTKRLKINYPTPYIRNLPTSLEFQSGEGHHPSEMHGPFYQDQFNLELLYWHKTLTTNAPVLTSLQDSQQDLELVLQAIDCIAENLNIEDRQQEGKS